MSRELSHLDAQGARPHGRCRREARHRAPLCRPGRGADGAGDPAEDRRGPPAQGRRPGHRTGSAGIQAAKRTDEWIPLCHSLPLDELHVELTPDTERSRVVIEARAAAHARTGVEMEALVAVGAAGLTLYDMCKGVDREMVIDSIHLVRKRGGKSGEWERPDDPLEPPG